VSHSPEMYDAWYERAFGRYADRLEKNLVSKLLPEVNRKLILDMGCGTGKYSIMLSLIGDVHMKTHGRSNWIQITQLPRNLRPSSSTLPLKHGRAQPCESWLRVL
jgi:SAM-dependent methyltransferase